MTTNAELIARARAVVCDLRLSEHNTAGGVGAALLTADGNVYTGICFDLPSGLGFCAEVAAIAQMLTNRETVIKTIVAATENGFLPPCGRCRETMVQVDTRNFDTQVIIGEAQEVSLFDLLPEHWLRQS